MTDITYRVGLGRNLSASEVDGNFSRLNAEKVETSVYSALAASVMALAAISGASAGTTQLTAGTLVFADSNGMSFGLNGATLTGSVRTDYLTTAAQSGHSHGNPTLALTNLSGTTASNSAGLTLSLSAAAPGAGAGISAAGSSQSNGTIVFSNSNGVSFGMNGSTVTAAHNGLTTAAQSGHSHGDPTLALTNLSGSTASASNGLTLSLSAAAQSVQSQGSVLVQGSSGQISFSNSNGISFGFNASTITASHNGLTTAAQSNHSHGNPTLALTNLSGTTASNSNGLTISLSAVAPGGGGGIAAAAGTQTGSSGTIAFADSNGISFGMSGSSQITASYTVPSTAGLLSAVKISAGTTSNNLSALTFSNGNGVTFGMDGSTITASVAAVAGAQTGISGIGNSQTTFTSGTVGFSELGAVTIRSTTGNQFQISVNSQSVQTQGSVQVQGSTGAISFANSNGITFGFDASTITASHNGLITQSGQAVSAANGSSAFQTLTFADGGGVSWSTVAGGLQATVKTDYLTTARASNDAIGLNTALTANGVSMTANSSGLSLNFPAFLTTAAQSNHSHGNPTLALTNLSGTTASASNGLTLSLSAAAPVAQTAQTIGIYASSQTFGQSSSSAVDARSLSIVGSGGVSVGMSAGSLLISGQTTAPQTAFVFSNSNNVSFGTNGSTVTATATFAQTAQTQSNVQGISAGTQIGRTGDIVFSNSNGISFGLSGSNTLTASYTVPSTAGLLSAINISGGTTSNNLSAVTFSNANGVSFGMDGSVMTASVAAAGGAQTGISGFGNSETTYTSGTVALSALGAVTIRSTTGQQLQISVNAQTVQTQGSVAVLGSTGAISFDNANGITFGANASTITASHNGLTTAALSNHSHGNPTLALTNLSGTTASNSAGLTLSLSAAAPAGGGVAIQVSDTTHTSGTVVFSNANGITFGSSGANGVTINHALQFTSNTSAITSNALHTSASRVMNIVAATNNTGGGAASLSSNVSFSNANGVSFYTSAGGAVVASVQTNYLTTARASNDGVGLATAQTNVTWTVNSNGISINAGGYNGTGFTSTTTAGTAIVATNNTAGLSLAFPTIITNALTTARASNDAIGLNTAQTNVTWTVNSSGISFNAAGYAGTTSGFTGANISATLTHNTAGLAMSMSVAPPGAATLTAYAVGNTTQSTSGTIPGSVFSMQGTGGVSVGISNGSVVVSGPALTSLSVTGALSASSNGSTISLGVGTVTASIIGNTTQTSTGSVNLNALVFSGAGAASLGISAGTIIVSAGGGGGGVAISAGTQSVSTGTMVFSNSNGVSFGMSGSSRITASVETSYAGSNHSHGNPTLALTNLSGTTASNSNGLTLSLSAAAAGGGAALSAAGSSQNAGTIVFSNSNGVSFGMNGSTITATVTPGAAAGIAAIGNSNTTYTSGTVSLVAGAGAITIGSETGQRITFAVPQTSSLVGASGIAVSTNGSTISVYRPAGSYFGNLQYVLNTQTQTVGQSTSVVFPFDLKEPENVGFMQFPHTISIASTSFASTGNTSYSYNQAETHNLVLYSRGTGASSMSLHSVFSTSAAVVMSIRLSRNTTNNISVTHGISFPVSNGTSSLSFSYAATNSTDQFSTTHLTALTGLKLWDTQFSTYLDPAIFWLNYGVTTTQTTQQTAALSNIRLQHSHIAMSMPNNTIGLFGQANAASNAWRPGVGSFSTAGGGTISAFPISAVSSSSSHNVPHIQFMRIG